MREPSIKLNSVFCKGRHFFAKKLFLKKFDVSLFKNRSKDIEKLECAENLSLRRSLQEKKPAKILKIAVIG